jgi:hypothetical protein
MTQSAMKRKVLNGVGGLIKKAPHVFELPTVDGTCVGNSTTAFALSYTASVADLVYLNSDFKFAKADSNGATAPLYSNMLGIVMEAGVDGDFVLVALSGSIVYSTNFPTFTGVPVFMSETAGSVTETEPSGNSSASRVLGYGVNADMLYFEPAPVAYSGKATQIVLPTVAAQVIGPIDATRVSGYTTAAAYDVVILNGSNKWVKADANQSASLSLGILGMVVVGGATDVAITVALKGAFIKTAGTYTLGANQYLSETAAGITETLPASGTSYQMVVGRAWTTTVLQLAFEGHGVTSGA